MAASDARAWTARRSTPPREPRERLDLRLTRERKELLQRAADLQGQSMTAFVLDSVSEKAEETILWHRMLKLSARDSRAFVDALLNPPAPNAALKAALHRHRDTFGA